MTTIGVLGPMRAGHDGTPIDLGPPRQRAVLARLVAAGGHVVSVDRLVEDLWSGDPPPRAQAALQVYVSNLRRVLEPNRPPRRPALILVTAAPGYALRLPTFDVDAWRFEAALRTARRADEMQPQAAVTVLDEALTCWGGATPYAEFAGEPWADRECERLGRLRLTAVEQRAKLLLDLDRPDEVVLDLDPHVREHPLREQAAALLTVALYRLGRQADALDVLRSVRAALVEQLGIDPSPELRSLETDLLRQHPRLGPPTPTGIPGQDAVAGQTEPLAAVPDRQVAAVPPLRRAAELARMRSAADRAATAGLGICWVGAEAGAGKSTLARQFAGALAADGWTTATGTCPDAAGAPPGWAWYEVVTAAAEVLPLDESETRGLRLLPGTGTTRAVLGEYDGFHLRQALGSYLARLAGHGPLLVVIEDLHRADGETLHILRHLAATLSGAPVLVVATYRPDEVTDDLVAARGTLAGVPAVELGLGDLNDAELHHDILDRTLRRLPAPVADGQGAAGNTSNLPHSISTLVGRVGERRMVSDLLSRHRLVTLTGAGGMGKTRLALAVAGARTDADGPWFVELAGLHEPAVLAERLCATLQITGSGGVDALVAALRSRAMLIVLDNCEHLAGAVGALVSVLLRACPKVRVLATSRQSLRVDGEQLFEVPPLSGGAEGEAVTLFTARAAAVLTGWSPGADERRLVARLCAALDGMPLAIEFAAAQCRVLSPQQILAQLDDRFALLVGERTSSRYRTLLGLMDSWYELLTEAERELLQALAVFEGGFALAATRAVTGRSDTLVDLTSLVEKSLVTVVTVMNGDDRRYLMLETVRQYALRCTPADRRDALLGRHTAWIHELADTASDELRGPDSATWMRLLHVESDNVRAALQRANTAGDTAAVLRIAGGLYWYWYRQGRVADGLHYLEPALRQADPRIHEHAWIARAALGLALLRYLGGAHGQIAEVLAVAGRHGAATADLGVRAQVLATIAYFEAGGGAVREALEHATEALALAQAVGNGATAAEALMCIGEAQRRSGLAVQAEAALAAALYEADRCGHGWATVSVLWLMSKIELSRDRPGPASVLVRRMLEEAQRRADTTGWLAGVATYACLLARAGRAEEAAELLGTLRSMGDRVGYQAEAMDADLAGYLAEIPSGSPPDQFMAAEARGRDRTVAQTMAWLRSAASFAGSAAGGHG